MPKVTGTRKQRASELRERLQRGPSFSRPFDGTQYTSEEAQRQYRAWVHTWILPDLMNLVPELRKDWNHYGITGESTAAQRS